MLAVICFKSELPAILTLVHQLFEKLWEVPCEMSVEKCATVDVSHIIFGDKGYIFAL